MIQVSPKEWTRFTRAQDVNCDLLHAHFIDHRYDRHIHCGYITVAGALMTVIVAYISKNILMAMISGIIVVVVLRQNIQF